MLAKSHISNEKYSEFVASQGADFDLESFEQGQPVTAHKVALRHLDENVIDRLAKAYLRKSVRSRYMRMAAAYSWLESKFNARIKKYDLTKYFKVKQKVTGSRPFLWSKEYTNIVNELLDIHPTSPEEQEYFRQVVGHKTIKDLLYIDMYRRALVRIIHGKGSFTELFKELGEDENKAQLCLENLLTSAVYTGSD